MLEHHPEVTGLGLTEAGDSIALAPHPLQIGSHGGPQLGSVVRAVPAPAGQHQENLLPAHAARRTTHHASAAAPLKLLSEAVQSFGHRELVQVQGAGQTATGVALRIGGGNLGAGK